MNIMELVGSEKQVKWAASVVAKFQALYPDVILPDVKSAEWWIKNRDKSIEALIGESATGVKIATPFTRQFPMYSHNDAILALKSLGSDFVVLDLETSGLKRDTDEILEIAIVHYGTGEILLNSVVKPLGTLVTNDISKIEPEEFFDAPTFLDMAPRIEIILNAYPACSYNASFDFPFLQFAYIRYGLPVPKITASCAMRIFSAFMDSETNFSLEKACKMMRIEQEKYGKSHRALSDVLVTIELLKSLLVREGTV